MTAVELFVELHRRGVRLRAHKGRLGFAPAEAVDDRLRAGLVRHKTELLILLAEEKAERPPIPPEPPTNLALEAAAPPVVRSRHSRRTTSKGRRIRRALWLVRRVLD